MSATVTTRLRASHLATSVASYEPSASARRIDIQALRRAARISQVELAIRAQISRPRLSAAEHFYLHLSQSELERLQSVLTRETGRRAADIRAALGSSNDEDTHETAGISWSAECLNPATATADFTSLELAMGLVREWQLRDLPLLGYERMLNEVKAAIEREVPGWAPSVLKVAEKIRVAQERYFAWLKKRKDDYDIDAHLWFRDGLYRRGAKQWHAYLVAMLKGKQPATRQTLNDAKPTGRVSVAVLPAGGKPNGKAAVATADDDSRYTIDLVDEYGRPKRVNLQEHLSKYLQGAQWQKCWRDKVRFTGFAHVKLTPEELKVCGRSLFEFAQWLEWGEVRLADPDFQKDL